MNTKLESTLYIVFFVITGVALLWGAFWAVATEKRLKRFFLGKKANNLEDTIKILEENNLTKAELYRSIGIALSGKLITPPITESMAIIGREETIARLNEATKKK